MSDFNKDEEKPKLRTVFRTVIVQDKENDYLKTMAEHEAEYRFVSRVPQKPEDCRTTMEMVQFLASDAGKGVELEAKLLHFKEGEGVGYRKLNKKKFMEAVKASYSTQDKVITKRFRESFGNDSDGNGFSNPNSVSGSVGNDFTPLLGGPFYKQLYYYNDWLKAHQDCFFASNHDPFAKDTVRIMVDFTLGKGFDVVASNEAAQAVWDAFEEANDFQKVFGQFADELVRYGEHMWWWLPDHNRYIDFASQSSKLSGAKTKDDVPKALIPRIRLVDPSNFVEIITYPEDITRRLAYVWMTPTQYQTFTAKDEKTGKVVNTSKFIYQQIPADEIIHCTVNNVSNEKRGRSDLFTGLPWFKRLRDSVNYAIINHQKNSAWCLDTEIDGDEADIAAYMDDQASRGTVPSAGSEFVHTKSIQRKYNANSGGDGGKSNNSFEWSLSMACTSTGIPVSYYATHLSGGSTKGSAIVATEPVAKLFERRQEVYKDILGKIAAGLFQRLNIKATIEVSFPEIITQDRSQKMKDIYLGEQARWFSPKRAATSGAQEMGYKDYDYDAEMAEIRTEQEEEVPEFLTPGNPLTKPGIGGEDGPAAPAGASPDPGKSDTAVTSKDKKKVKDNRGI